MGDYVSGNSPAGRKRYVEVRPGEYAEEVVIVGGANVLRTVESLEFYASAVGGRRAFNTTTGFQTVSGTGEQPLAALLNPTGSNVDFALWYGEFQSTVNTDFQRYRGSAITPTGTKREVVNMGGGSMTSKAELYIAGGFTATGGTVSKTALIGGYSRYPAEIHGSVRLRPGQSIRWTITGPGGNPSFKAAIYLEWAEIPAE